MPGNKQCSAYGCVNGPRNCYRERGISLHRFPFKHPEQLEAWLKRIGRDGFVPSVNSLLCSEHFVESDFCYQPFTCRRQLKPGVVPSIFLDLPKKSKRKISLKSGNEEGATTNSSSELGKEITETVIIPTKWGSRRKGQLSDFSKERFEAPDKDLNLECSEYQDISPQNFSASNMCRSAALSCGSKTCVEEMRRLSHDLCQTILKLKWLQEKVQELQALAGAMDLDVLNVLLNGHEEGKGLLDKVCHLVRFLMDEVKTDAPKIHLTPDSFALRTIKTEPNQYHETTALMDSPEEPSLSSSFISHLAHQQGDSVGVETGSNCQRENSQCPKICYVQGATAPQSPATIGTKHSLSESTNKMPSNLHHVLSKQLSSSSHLREMISHTDPDPKNKSIFLVGPLSANESGVCTLDSQVQVIPMRAWDPNTTDTTTRKGKGKGKYPGDHETIPPNSEDAFSIEGVNTTTRVNDRQRECMDHIGGAQSPDRCHFDKPKTMVCKKMCDLCGRFCINAYILKLHIKSVHKNEKPFECRHCTKRFSTQGSRNFHMKIHSDERPHQCSLCSKTFKMKNTLNKHQLTHSSERPFHCVLCDTYFKQNSSLTLHRKQFHE